MSDIEAYIKEKRAKMEILAKEISSNVLFYYLMRGPVYFLTFKSYYSYYHAELPAFRAELARRYNDERLNKICPQQKPKFFIKNILPKDRCARRRKWKRFSSSIWNGFQ